MYDELYKGSWITLNLLCRQLSAGTESELDRRLVVEEIEKELSELRSEKSIMEIEECINKYSDNVVTRLRAQCAFLKPSDIKFLVFLMAGFSSHGVCIIYVYFVLSYNSYVLYLFSGHCDCLFFKVCSLFSSRSITF